MNNTEPAKYRMIYGLCMFTIVWVIIGAARGLT